MHKAPGKIIGIITLFSLIVFYASPFTAQATTLVQTNDGATNTGFNITGVATSSTVISGTDDSASVVLELTAGSPEWNTTTLDSTNNVGLYTSIALDSNGYPRISYYDNTSADLKYAQCDDSTCSTKNVLTLDSTGSVGFGTSIGIDSSDNTHIAYNDSSNTDLKYLTCTDAACTSNTKVVASVSAGTQPSLVIGGDDFGRVTFSASARSYYIQCTNTSCSTNVTTSLGSDIINPVLDLGSDGFGRIVYSDIYDGLHGMFICSNDACSPRTSIGTSISPTSAYSASISVSGTIGFANYYSYSDLSFLRCNDASCSGYSRQTVDSVGNVGNYPSVKMGSDGFARISYYDATNGDLKFAQCTNSTCSTKNLTTVDSTDSVGEYTSIALTDDDLAYISYYDATNDALKLAYQAIPYTYSSSGTYTSGPIDIGDTVAVWGTLSWTHTGGQTITMKARSDADGDFSDATAWRSCTNITSGANLSTGGCVTAGHQYIQYQATLSTSDTSTTPSLDDVTIEYSLDSTAPVISSIVATPGDTSATITWTTDEEASTRVGFGPSTTYSSTTPETDTSTRVTSHNVTITPLLSCTTYQYQVYGADAASNAASSTNASFTTTGCTGSATVESQETSTITTVGGGSLTTGSLAVTVPSSYSGTQATFQIKKIDSTATLAETGSPTNYTPITGTTYNISALTDEDSLLSTFDQQLTISLTFDTSDITGLDPATLKIFRNDGSSWTQLNDCTPTNTSISCTTSNFSIFGLFGQQLTSKPSGHRTLLKDEEDTIIDTSVEIDLITATFNSLLNTLAKTNEKELTDQIVKDIEKVTQDLSVALSSGNITQTTQIIQTPLKVSPQPIDSLSEPVQILFDENTATTTQSVINSTTTEEIIKLQLKVVELLRHVLLLLVGK